MYDDGESTEYELWLRLKSTLDKCFNELRSDPDKEWTELQYEVADAVQDLEILIMRKEE